MAEEYDEDPHDQDVFAPVSAPSFKSILVDTAQGITRITLNRPPANVLSIDMMQELATAIESLEYQRDVKLVTFFARRQVLLGGLRARRPPRRPRLHDARELPAHLRGARQARQGDARGGRGPGARRRLHARGRLRHRARGAERQARPPRDPRRGLQHRGRGAPAAHRGPQARLRDPDDGHQPDGGRRRADRARHARRARRASSRPRRRPSCSASRNRARRSCSCARRAIAGGLDLPYEEADPPRRGRLPQPAARAPRTSRRGCGPWPRSASRSGRTGERGRARARTATGTWCSRRASSTRRSSRRCGCARPASRRA